MGYCYDNYGHLCCDSCGNGGGVRKRQCPHKVLSSTHRSSNGKRIAVHYCYPPALCDACFKKHGGNRKIHEHCKERAAESQRQDDAEQARLDAGDHLIVARYGDWHEAVPAGMVGCLYGGRLWGQDERRVLVAKEHANVEWLEDLPAGAAIPWDQTAVVEKGAKVA